MSGLGDGWVDSTARFGAGRYFTPFQIKLSIWTVALIPMGDWGFDLLILSPWTDQVALQFPAIEEAITAANAIIAGRGVK